jgi:Dynamin family
VENASGASNGGTGQAGVQVAPPPGPAPTNPATPATPAPPGPGPGSPGPLDPGGVPKPAHDLPATRHGAGTTLHHRLRSLEEHLRLENPVLVGAVQSFRVLDSVAHRMGLLPKDRSFATQIPWWPLISILGTFSAGKSSFVNHYLGYNLQRTGNQAVDDKFTVICYTREQQVRVLPGIALDTDVRFPFFGMSAEIDKVAPGEGQRIDTYVQLKTCPSEVLRGKIIIDSPGFDADAQRTSTLRIANHMIGLSDLVLVFFDARHPEPGAMRDTLRHLVSASVGRPDATKILYILNQMDTTLREDNAEDVVAAWQRALAEHGLTAGRFYCIYNPDVPVQFGTPELRRRAEFKRDQDLSEIKDRMHQVEVGRSYRIVGMLEKNARYIQDTACSTLAAAMGRWRRLVLWTNCVVLGIPFLILFTIATQAGWWQGVDLAPTWGIVLTVLLPALLLAAGIFVHFKVRSTCAEMVTRRLDRDPQEEHYGTDLRAAFARSTSWWRSIFLRKPAGWTKGSLKRVQRVQANAKAYVQSLNNHFADPSG